MSKYAWLWLLLSLGVPLTAYAATQQAQEYDDLGMALYRQGLYAKSIPYFQNAVQADPQDWEGYENLGNAYFKINANTDALNAYQKSLQINPDNSTLENIVQTLQTNNTPVPANAELNQSAVAPAPPPANAAPPSSQSAESEEPIQGNPQTQAPPPQGGQPSETIIVRHRRRRYVENFEPTYADGLNPIDHAKFWAKFETAYNYSLQSDLNNSASSINSESANGTLYGDSNWSGTATMSSNGYMAGGEFGFLLDPYNGLAIGFRYIQSNDFVFNAVNSAPATVGSSHDFENGDFTPYVVPITLDYYMFFPDRDGRFFISLGGGYYAAAVNISENYNFSNYNDASYYGSPTGTLTGGGFGCEASIGREFAIGRHFGLEVFARGRFAQISGLRGVLSDGNSYGLDKFSDGTVDINQGSSGTATLDFTGFDAGISLNWYSF